VTEWNLPLRPSLDSPLVVAYGLGVDSTAMLIEFVRRGIRPDLILFADIGGETSETFARVPASRCRRSRVKNPAQELPPFSHPATCTSSALHRPF
jgi:hypothetical protein